MDNIELLNLDSLAYIKSMPDKSVDLILTDPMYDIDRETIEMLHKEFMRVSKGAIVFMPPENQWTEASQYAFWIKPISTKNTIKRYSRFVEMIFFTGDIKWNPGRHWSQYTNVFTDLVDGETAHRFEKPTSLIRRLMLNHSDVGDVILDPFMGSGTVGVVARDLGRKFIGIEKDEKYYDMANERIYSKQN